MTSSMYGLLSKAPYGVYAVDMSQTILFWNRSAEWILGHTAEEAVGLRCYEVLQSQPYNALGLQPLYRHAVFPFGFHLQVSRLTQKLPPNFS